MPLSEAAILAWEQKQKIFEMPPKSNFDLYVISFICTNFEAFTTFSAIFTRIRCTTRISDVSQNSLSILLLEIYLLTFIILLSD